MSSPAAVPSSLAVLLDGEIAGYVHRADGAYVLEYGDQWRSTRRAFPLSLSLPLAASRHSGDLVERYLRGLLTDDPARRARIAARFGVSSGDAFALLAHIGEDCPGAVQFVRPGRLETLLGDGAETVRWFGDHELAEQLRALGEEKASLGIPEDEGQFSLPGALAKVALRFDGAGSRWGRPSGRAATTHILKPPRAGMESHPENEHLCLTLAREVGFEAAHSWVLRIEDQIALVVERYDRVVEAGVVRRIHQEDMSQALGADPELKYASQGAPTLASMTDLLRQWTSRPVEEALRLIEAVAFNWAIVGTDAHPRNYSVLIESGPTVRLAPLYDIASALFLTKRRTNVDPDDRRLAMAVGGRTRVGDIDRSAWEDEARRCGLRPRRVLDAVERIVSAIPPALDRLAVHSTRDGIDTKFVERFARQIRGQAHLRLSALR